MPTSSKIIAIVPAHNEAATIFSVVQDLRSHVAEVVVVDDASTDATGARAKDAGAILVQNEQNHGYDSALNRGFEEGARRGADIFLTFDADGEHDANDIPRVLAPLFSGVADVVAGQRPRTRHWSEGLFSLYTRMRFGIRDPLCGMKAYTRAVYDSIGFFDNTRSIGTELMLRAARAGFRVAVVDVQLRVRRGASRFYSANLRGNARIMRAMWRMFFV